MRRTSVYAVVAIVLATPPLAAQNAATEEPPVVIANSCRPPVYPTMMRAAQMDGRVLLEFAVDSLGRVDPSSITTISSTHSQFEEAARRAVTTCRFQPGKINRQLARMTTRMPYNFTIRSERTRR